MPTIDRKKEQKRRQLQRRIVAIERQIAAVEKASEPAYDKFDRYYGEQHKIGNYLLSLPLTGADPRTQRKEDKLVKKYQRLLKETVKAEQDWLKLSEKKAALEETLGQLDANLARLDQRNPRRRRFKSSNPGRQHIAGASAKAQRLYEKVLASIKKRGKYMGRQKEVAARIVRKMTNPPALNKTVKMILREYVKDGTPWEQVRSRLIDEGFGDRALSAAQDFYAEEKAKAGSSRTSTAGSSTRSPAIAPASSPTQAIVEGMTRLDPGARQGALIALPELREFLKGRFKTKKAFDDAVLSAAESGAVVLHRHVFPGSLSEKERTSLVYSAPYDFYYVGVAFRNPMKKQRKNKTIIRAKRVIALTNRAGRRRARNPLDRGTRGWILVFIREQVREGRSWADSKKLLEVSGFDADVIKAAESMYKAESGGKGSAKTKKRMGINPARRRNADAGYLRTQKTQLAAVDRSIKTLRKRITKAKDPNLKSSLRALMIEMQGTREDLKRAIRLARPRRNSEKRDSDHPIEVTRHWRAGPPGYLTPWQRAHAAGQGQLFDTGIQPARRRNPKKAKKAKKRTAANPAGSTRSRIRSTVEKFGGRKSKKNLVSVEAPLNAPATVGKIGRVKRILLKSGRYYDFDQKTAPYLATDSKEKLHVVGGKYRMNPAGSDQGPIKRIVYEASKPHLGQKTTARYFHDFGEEDGRMPRLKIDSEGLMHIVGGNYSLEADGIHN